jgi:hypothetical protein
MKDYKDLSNSRKILSIVILIVVAIIYLMVYINREKWLPRQLEITYPDKCVETYINNVLNSSICTKGRELNESMYRQSHPVYDMKLPINLSK